MAQGTAEVKVAGKPKLWERRFSAGIECPGCTIPLAHRLLCEVVEEMGIENNTIQVGGIGCTSGGANAAVDVDGVQAAHGRSANVASAIKRLSAKGTLVYTIQGDGDCMAIGSEPLIQAASYGEKITIVMVNNTNFGRTGGQMALTSLVGQVTTTTPKGRDPELAGCPVHVAELLAGFKTVVYSARGSVDSPANYQKTKKYLRTAFSKQMDGLGLTFVEILSVCPSNWHMKPLESLNWLREKMIPEFPLGEFKNLDKSECVSTP